MSFIARVIAEFVFDVRREMEKFERLDVVAQEVGKLEVKDDGKIEVPTNLQHAHLEQPLLRPDSPVAGFGFTATQRRKDD